MWLRRQLKGTAWLSAVSSQSGRDTRGAQVLQVGASWAGMASEGGKNQGLRSDGVEGASAVLQKTMVFLVLSKLAPCAFRVATVPSSSASPRVGSKIVRRSKSNSLTKNRPRCIFFRTDGAHY